MGDHAGDHAPSPDPEFSSAFLAERSLIEGLSVQEARAVLDAKESLLMISIRALRAVRNTLAGIHILPDEVLAEMFTLLTRDIDIAESGRKRSEWLTIRQVCRRWRSVALGTPKLWTTINGSSNIRVIKEFVHRSKSAPIELFINARSNSTGKIHDLMAVVSPHFHRVRNLRFSLPLTGLGALITHFTAPAPRLEVLCLRQTSGRRILGLEQTPILSEDLFNRQTPALRQVYLEQVSLPLTAPLFTGLLHLELFRQNPVINPSVEIFLDALERCPYLQTLILVDAGPALSPTIVDYPPPSRLLELPHLHELTLSNRPVDVARVLAHLGVPSTCTMRLSCNLESSDDDLGAVLPQDCSALKPLANIVWLELNVEDVTSISLAGRVQHSPDIAFSLTLHVDEGMLKPRLFLSQLGSFLPLPRLEHLEVIDCAPYISKEKWREVLSRFPTLEILTTKETSDLVRQGQLLEALRMSPLQPDFRDTVVCPRLKVLRFFGLDCAEGVVVENVETCCRARAAKGAPLDVLKVADLSPIGLAKLRSIVPVVDATYQDY